MGGNNLARSKSADAGKSSEQPSEKKKGFIDWMNIIKPGNEEKEHWVSLASLIHERLFLVV